MAIVALVAVIAAAITLHYVFDWIDLTEGST